uniref:Uncharacterized protein n=1 Tax=Dunaliella tertiolecta TaxID=3047 RepID=A0A7S3RAJ7_DUNTE|mmetsp:Transcript_18551/g.52114  ORF Transcript_18551/g.52114 Transcript_18551/m.52114 type:complete len:357 (+) Transcript_18551:116-1186(+)|eukprot:CAMPEP_0202352270 /NCGR_PEP_ID=MMETSP1126-20121109/8534_1 /ASSEMBLY_ACC=CAM_ASM_000457 /TAXON_ID=3047 /ORGANISM="Dunaliella tertiolecta, Strain CCMP1320" /LENGTH=356 /DNA_ID=CAMNT_0048944457 /DNA_START=64 /DNA_END=1134 /DNA_ORIENTATION=+
MSTVKASWSQLSVDGAVLAHATNLTGTMLATSSSVPEGSSFVQVWVPDVAAADWMVKSVIQVPHPITTLAWAHPESGSLLAGASERGAVCVWEPPRPWQATKPGQEQSAMELQEEDLGDEDQEWQQNATLQCGVAPIRHISFAPRQHGLLLSAASDDGCVRIWEAGRPLAPNSWTLVSQLQVATPRAKGGPGCTSMSWRCYSPGVPPSLVVGTADEAVVMQYVHAHMAWKKACSLKLSAPGRVASIHWAPCLGRPQDLVAAAHGSTVDIFSLQASSANGALEAELHSSLAHDADVWKVEWNMLGTCLGTATVSNRISVWRSNFVGEFSIVSAIQGCSKVAAEGSEAEGMEEGGEVD